MSGVLHIVTGVCLAIATIAYIVGVAGNEWYTIKISGSKSTVGLFKTCSSGECESIDFASVASASCNREESAVSARFGGMRAATILGLIFAFAGAGASFATLILKKKITAIASLVLGILAAFGGGAAIALFAFVLENWLYCDGTFCDANTFPDCSSTYGWSFYIAAVGVLFSLIGIICAALAYRNVASDPAATDGAAAQREGSPLPYGNGSSRGDAYQTTTTTTTTTYQTTTDTVPPPPEGDWVYDEASGLYWSDTQYLYLDTTTNEYYDPNSGLWYSPETGEWYSK